MNELRKAVKELKEIEERLDKTSYNIGILLENGGTSVADISVCPAESKDAVKPIDFKKLLKKDKKENKN